MVKVSAGILLYYFSDGNVKVFLVHPGGPFFAGKDSWGIPKGEVDDGENKKDLLSVALREFEEETGIKLNKNGKFSDLGFAKRTSGKIVYVWAFHGSGKEKFVKSNSFEMEWPPKSGDMKKFPEVDDGRYFEINTARRKIHKYQIGSLDRLEEKVGKLTKDRQWKLF
jgi:predicted NUDIX family NTP pyrophosphohydrolase